MAKDLFVELGSSQTKYILTICADDKDDHSDDKVKDERKHDGGGLPEEELDQPSQIVHIWHFFKLL